MWLLLCTSDDYSALWAASRLRARGLSSLVVLTPELLHYSFRWQHRLGNDAAPTVEFTLADGRPVCGSDIRGVLNRIPFLPPHLFAHLPSEDRSYALQEWTALHTSWLAALQAPVLNLPVMQGFCGAWRHASEWTWLASHAGLETVPFRQSSTFTPAADAPRLIPRAVRTVFVIDGIVVGAGADAKLTAACAQLARAARTRLIGIDLEVETNLFVDASPRPLLQLGGDPLIAALHSSLTP